jgi:Secretion system C-terminal sorting domain
MFYKKIYIKKVIFITASIIISLSSFATTTGDNKKNLLPILETVAPTSTITITSVPLTNCAGVNISVPFTINGLYNSGNVFRLQLSNAVGSFAAPVNIGNFNGAIGGTIAANIPAATVQGSGYRVRIMSTSPIVTSAINASNITINALPIVSIASTNGNSICAGGSTILTASGASTYLWITGAISPAITVTSSVGTSTYAVVGKSAQGCAKSANYTLTTNALPVVTSSPNVSICLGDFKTLTASGAASYLWSNGVTTTSTIVAPTATTTFTVTGKSVQGCSNTATTIVTVNPAMSLVVNSSNGNSICFGTSTVLSASGASSYVWSNGATTSSITVSPFIGTSTYTVTGTNVQGCTKTATYAVTASTKPTILITSTNGNKICAGTSTTLTASNTANFIWNTGATTAAINVTPVVGTQVYTVTGGTAGCSNTASYIVDVVPLPITNIISSNGNSICEGVQTTLTANAGAASYSWNTGETTAAITIKPNVGTTVYTVTGTNAEGCVNSLSYSVTVNPLPTIIIAGSNGNSICAGTSTILSATGASSYVWSNGAAASSITVSPAVGTNNFSVTGTSAQGCSSSANYALSVNSLPAVSINSSNGSNICIGGTTLLTATGAANYTWSTGAITPTITVLAAAPAGTTAYTVKGTDVNGCNATVVYALAVNPLPTITIASNNGTSICRSTPTILSATGATSYTWSTGEIASSISVAPVTSTTYTVTGKDAQSCYGTASILLNVLACRQAMTISNAEIEGSKNDININIYPNPVSDMLQINLTSISKNERVEMYNAFGMLVLSKRLININNNINVSKLNNGIYHLQILENNKIIFTENIIKR